MPRTHSCMALLFPLWCCNTNTISQFWRDGIQLRQGLPGQRCLRHGEAFCKLTISPLSHHLFHTNTTQAAFASPEQGINTAPVHGGERELRSLYLPAFKRSIIDAGATSIMSSYNSYDGVPTVADHHLLTEILRDEWGYEYFVISDAGGTARLDNAFNICGPKDHECITLEVYPRSSPLGVAELIFSSRVFPLAMMSRWAVDTGASKSFLTW